MTAMRTIGRPGRRIRRTGHRQDRMHIKSLLRLRKYEAARDAA